MNKFEINIWWSLIRPKHDFNLAVTDLEWLNRIVPTLTDVEIEDLSFPLAPSKPLQHLLDCLRYSADGELREDAFEYLREHCKAFRDRVDRLD